MGCKYTEIKFYHCIWLAFVSFDGSVNVVFLCDNIIYIDVGLFCFYFTKTNKLKAGIKSKDRFGYEVVVSISKSIISCILFICCEHNAKENGFWLFSSGPEESRSYMN